MKTATRPQYHRLQRILEMVREGTRAGSLPNCGHFIRELEVSRRTLMRDLDFLRDDHHAPIAYDDSRKGFRLTDATFKLAPVELTQREVFTHPLDSLLDAAPQSPRPASTPRPRPRTHASRTGSLRMTPLAPPRYAIALSLRANQTPPNARRPHSNPCISPCAQTIWLATLVDYMVRAPLIAPRSTTTMRATGIRPPLSNAGLRARMLTLVPGSGPPSLVIERRGRRPSRCPRARIEWCRTALAPLEVCSRTWKNLRGGAKGGKKLKRLQKGWKGFCFSATRHKEP